MEIRENTPSNLRQDFLKEYSAQETILRYMKKTAGHGIGYLLEHDYTDIYLEVVDKYIPKAKTGKGLRLLEFGCGAGMDLLHLVSVLERRGMVVDFGCGTDFSEGLIESAKVEAKEILKPQLMDKVRFCVARTENLIGDMTRELGRSRESLVGSFDLIFGVNTVRYCHRLKNEKDCAEGIHELLTDGGVCIVIDMNDKFPAFRSRFRDRMRKVKDAYYLPSLDEYARPFASAGFEILRKENFCWIPHSAGKSLTAIMRFMTPLLNGLGRRHAMRSLVISRKTARRAPVGRFAVKG
jgi:SAM-dependent methyltransferase